MLRHASFRFQEFSQRYADPTKELSFVLREARLQDDKNRQNSIVVDDTELHEWWETAQQEVIALVKKHYVEAINRGIAKECARVILPEGNTVSKLYMSGSIRSWIHYIDVRADESTQLEHRVIALACAKAIAAIFPMADSI
jgi:thymidylate synthase (FAD)